MKHRDIKSGGGADIRSPVYIEMGHSLKRGKHLGRGWHFSQGVGKGTPRGEKQRHRGNR